MSSMVPSPTAQLGRPCRALPRPTFTHALPHPRRTIHRTRRLPRVRADAETTQTTLTGAADAPWSAVDTQLRTSEAAQLPQELVYVAPTDGDRTWTSLKLAFALPWRRFAQDSVLTIKVGCFWSTVIRNV